MRAVIYLWFKRFLLLAWLIATTIFTINANEVEGIKNDYVADFIAAILLFNLIPWIVINRKRKKRKKASRALHDDAELYDPRKSIRYILISLVVIVGAAAGMYMWADKQVANLADSPTPTFLDTYQKGAADPKITWTQVTKRNEIPMTWHTCKQIKVLVNPGEVKSAVVDVKEVIDEINQLTSLNFFYAGLTTKQPFVDINNEYEVIVSFYSEDEASDGFKFKEAVGLGSANGYFGEVVSGGIGIRTPAYQKANRGLRKEILLHEFGHVLGLDHVNKKNELMSIQVNGSKTAFNKETKAYFLAHPGCEKK